MDASHYAVIRLLLLALGTLFVGAVVHMLMDVPRNAPPPPEAVMAMIAVAFLAAGLWRP